MFFFYGFDLDFRRFSLFMVIRRFIRGGFVLFFIEFSECVFVYRDREFFLGFFTRRGFFIR